MHWNYIGRVQSEIVAVWKFQKPQQFLFFLQVFSEGILNKSALLHIIIERASGICMDRPGKDQIWFRLEIFNSEGTVIGTCFSDQPIQTEHAGELKIEMSLSTDNFSPGRYTCVALLYDRNQFGNQNWIDRVYPALSFEIIPDETRDLNWNHRFWGHVQFDDIRIIKKDSAV